MRAHSTVLAKRHTHAHTLYRHRLPQAYLCMQAAWSLPSTVAHARALLQPARCATLPASDPIHSSTAAAAAAAAAVGLEPPREPAPVPACTPWSATGGELPPAPAVAASSGVALAFLPASSSTAPASSALAFTKRAATSGMVGPMADPADVSNASA
eukprot:scaffold307595_cov19-Tisochrysis_lutea.AAC.1